MSQPVPTRSSRHAVGQLTATHHVVIRALSVTGQVICLLGPNGAKLTAGFGSWQEVPVPRQAPFAQWIGRTLYQMDLDLLFDSWSLHGKGKHGPSLEGQIATLERFAVRPGGNQTNGQWVTPPAVRLWGPVPHPEFTWVIGGFDWGDSLRAVHTGARLRQAVTVHLMEYASPDAIPPLPPSPTKYVVVASDDLKKIAVRFLGKSSRWPDIVALNKGLRGWQIPRAFIGKTILIPPS